MKNKLFKLSVFIFFCLLFPTAFTLFLNGKQDNPIPKTKESGKTIIITSGSQKHNVDLEDFIPCVLANQLDINTNIEAVKAQAVVIRTYILYYMGDKNSIQADALNLSYTYYDELKEITDEDYTEYYKKLKTAVSETSGQTIKHEDKLIIPYFHAVSAGKTREGHEALGSDEYPYLQSKESPSDTNSPDYLNIYYIDKADFVNKLSSNSENLEISTDNPLENVQVLSRCSAGYISEIQIGNQTFSGDQIQMYFSLKSPYFELENFENQIRIICKGNGHGLGLSIYGASKMADEGNSYADILTYYYTDVIIE